MNRSSAGLGQGFGFGVGMIAAVIVVVLLLVGCLCAFCGGTAILVAVVNSEDSGPTAGSDQEPRRFPPAGSGSGGQADAGQAGGSVGVGQDVLVGNIRWKVLEAQDLGNTLQSDNEFTEPRTTAGRFIRVRFEIENRGSEARSFTDINLIDAQGRNFENANDVLSFIDAPEQCFLEQLNPNLPRVCTYIFEVPADATGLQAQVGDLELFGSEEAFINLNLTAAAPPAAPPAEVAEEPPPAEAEGQQPAEAAPPQDEEGAVSTLEGEEGQDTTEGQEQPPPAPAEGQESAGLGLGESIFVGNMRWVIIEVQDWGNFIDSEGQETDPLETEGRFIWVRFRVENTGNEVIPFQDIQLIDDQGRQFSPLLDSIWFISEDERCLSEQLEVEIPLDCTKIYDVPADANGLKVEVFDLADPSGGRTTVDLQLNQGE